LGSKVKEINEEFAKKEEGLQASKRLVELRETELNRLKDQIGNKTKQLASKDVEMETYKKTTEEKIFQLEAKVKEWEGKTGEPSVPF
jgi:ribosomal protein S13